MRITRLAVRDFKAHRSLEIEPAAGLTVVRGPNEAGKSTVRQAIELTFFCKPDSNRADVRRAWAWGSAEPPTVELDFEVDGVAGRLRKCFGGGRADGELVLDGQRITDYGRIGDELAGLLGMPTESFFRATASVGHSALEAVAGEEPVIGDRLQEAVSGATQGTARAKKKLAVAIHRYRTEGAKNPGLLKSSREGIARLERDLAEGEAALTSLQADRATWVEARERQQELDLRLAREQADLAEARRAEALATARDGAQARYERLKRATELTEQAAALRAELPTDVPVAGLREAVSRARELELEVSELEADLDTAAEAAAAEVPAGVPPRPMRWLAAAALLVGLGWAAMYLLSGTDMTVAFLLVGVIAVAVALTLGQAFRLARRRRQHGLVLQLAESAVAERQEHERELQDLDRRRRRELEGILSALGVADLDEARALLGLAEEGAQALAEIEGELRGLGAVEGNPRRLAEARDQAANEAAQAGHALAAMGKLAEEPAAARAELERKVAQTTPARDGARSEADKAQGRVEANLVDADVVAGLAERLAAARERHAEIESRLLVYEGTLAAIEAAETATLKTAARYLEEHMGPTVASVTDGRYDDVVVDEKTLAFRVRAPETGELVDVGELSQGTSDQLYLAARLGLVRLVTLDRRPPLILDDPFVTFDHARAERAIRLVRGFAHEHGFQVIYLTCSDRFDKLADELVVLPAPSGERVLASVRTPEPEAAQASAAPEPSLRFAPDPRRNPVVNAPRREDVAQTVPASPFAREPQELDGAGRFAALRKARAEAADAVDAVDAVDPLGALREAALGAEAADPQDNGSSR